jgi:predicted ATPase
MSDEKLDGGAGRPPFIRRVKIRNYKSIASCDVELGAFTLLVGRNGSGKSNFLDALAFVRDSLQTSLNDAIQKRGGVAEILHQLGDEQAKQFSVELLVTAIDGSDINYGFEIAEQPENGYVLLRESLLTQFDNKTSRYEIENGEVEDFIATPRGGSRLSSYVPPAYSRDRLYLAAASGLPNFRPVYNSLQDIGVYNFNPAAMKMPQIMSAYDLLLHDGNNIAAVLDRIKRLNPVGASRIVQYLSAIVPGIVDVKVLTTNKHVWAAFFLDAAARNEAFRLFASSMSDGTLRALACLVGVNQQSLDGEPIHLVGVEEPETALHPAAAGVLMDALHEAACRSQIIVTTHSPDLLDRVDFSTDKVLAVQMRDGETIIGPIDDVSRSAIDDHLYSAGELLRMDQIEPQVAEKNLSNGEAKP